MNTVSNTKKQYFDDQLYDAIRRDYSLRRTFEVPLEMEPAVNDDKDDVVADAFSPVAMWVCFSLGILVILFAAGM